MREAHPAEGEEDRDQGAGEGEDRADFLEGGAGVFLEIVADARFLFGGDDALPPGAVVEVCDGADELALADEFLDEAEGYGEAVGYLLLGRVMLVDGVHDPGAQIQGDGFHAPRIASPFRLYNLIIYSKFSISAKRVQWPSMSPLFAARQDVAGQICQCLAKSPPTVSRPSNGRVRP